MNREKDDLEKEDEEKRQLIELMKMQNETLKRIYQNTIKKEKKE